MRYAWWSFVRNKLDSMSAVLVIAILFCFLMNYTGTIQQYETELAQVCDGLLVEAHIEGAESGISPSISRDLRYQIINSGFVSKHLSKTRIVCGEKQYLLGLQDIESDVVLEEEAPYISWLDGYDAQCFSGRKKVCVLPRYLGYCIGDSCEIVWEVKTKTTETFLVVGLYGDDYVGSNEWTTIYCPLGAIEDLYEAQNYPMEYCGLEMELCDLPHINTFKEKMLALGLAEGANRLIINDYLLHEVTKQLREQIELLYIVFPILLLLIAGISFGFSMLFFRKRKQSIVILRSIGTKRYQVFCMFLLEVVFQVVFGCIIGCGIIILGQKEPSIQIEHIVLWLLFYFGGASMTIVRLTGMNSFTAIHAK